MEGVRVYERKNRWYNASSEHYLRRYRSSSYFSPPRYDVQERLIFKQTMATKSIRIGSAEDIFQYDDNDYDSAFEVDAPIRAGAPSAGNDVVRLNDLGGSNLQAAWPVGSVFLSIVSTNPATLLGFGTWVRIAEGQFLVGQKTGDSDFGTVENTGGDKNHTHSVDIPSATSGNPSDTVTVDNNLDGSTVAVASNTHTHDTDPAAVTSDNNNNLPPYFVIYAWKRTA